MFKFVFILPITALGLSGCGIQYFTEPVTNPVIEDEVGALQVIATTASRRLAYVRKEPIAVSKPTPAEITTAKEALNETQEDIQAADDAPVNTDDDPDLIHLGRFGGATGEYCAEPPPDAIEAFNASFSAAAEAAAETKVGAKQSLKAEFARDAATAVASMFRRSQGVQLYRDGAFFLCQAMMNGYMDAFEYRKALKHLRLDAKYLIELEFGTDYWKTPGNLPSITAPQNSGNGGTEGNGGGS